MDDKFDSEWEHLFYKYSNNDYGKFICRVNDMEDIYESYDKFRFGTLNLTGKQEKLWFDKD